MADALFVIVAATYVAILVALAAFGLNFLWLTWTAVRGRSEAPPVANPAVWPPATVQLPIFNELYVAERLIDAACRLRYPGSLEIQVLDDSTDETVELVEGVVARWRRSGVDVRHIRRSDRDGFKAGALAHGLELASGDVLAIFDADFIPPADFLVRTVPVLEADSGLAFVQARWGHANRDFSLLTQLQSLSIDGHMIIEQFARWRAGVWFNFNGTAGVWRRSALVDAGGWSSATLTEDLDLSYRAFLRGWRAAFVRDMECPAEIPASFGAYRRQQHRWARGTFECARRHLGAIWRSPVPLSIKVNATAHLLGYGIHLLMLAISLLYPLLLLLSVGHPQVLTVFGAIAVFNLTALAPGALFAIGQQQLGRRWWTALPRVVMLTVLGAGMMANTARAAILAFRRRPGVFERTPKFGLRETPVDWLRLRYQPRVDGLVIVEIGLAVLNATTAVAALTRGYWPIAIYAAIFATGLGASVSMTLGQALRTRWAARQTAGLVAAETTSD